MGAPEFFTKLLLASEPPALAASVDPYAGLPPVGRLEDYPKYMDDKTFFALLRAGKYPGDYSPSALGKGRIGPREYLQVGPMTERQAIHEAMRNRGPRSPVNQLLDEITSYAKEPGFLDAIFQMMQLDRIGGK